jgi:hypothetical protein
MAFQWGTGSADRNSAHTWFCIENQRRVNPNTAKEKKRYTSLNYNHQTLKAFSVIVAGGAAHGPATIL